MVGSSEKTKPIKANLPGFGRKSIVRQKGPLIEFMCRKYLYRQEGASGLADAAPAGKRVNMHFQCSSNDLANVLLS